MNEEHKKTIKEIFKTLLIGLGVVLFSGGLDFLNKGDIGGVVATWFFGYSFIHIAVNKL